MRASGQHAETRTSDSRKKRVVRGCTVRNNPLSVSGKRPKQSGSASIPFLRARTTMGVLNGKVAIITGASSGIGYAAAKLFATEGARLVVNARGKSKLDELVNAIRADGGVAIGVNGDVQDESTAKQ